MAKKIAFANNKGGVLKTTIAVNMAAIIGNKSKKKVLIIDVDPQADVSETWGFTADEHFYSQNKTLTNVLKGEVEVKKAINNLSTNIDVLSSTTSLGFLDIEKSKFDKIVKDIEGEYDFIIFDTNPGLSKISIFAILASDQIVVPTQMEPYSIKGLIKLVHGLQEQNRKVDFVVPTLYDGRSNLHKDGLSEANSALKPLGIKVTNTFISKSTLPAKAMKIARVPIYLWNKNTKVSKQLEKLAKELNLI